MKPIPLPSVSSLAKDTFIYGIGFVLSKSVGFLTLPILSRCLSSYEYGIIGMLNFFLLFAQSILGVGQGAGLAVVYFSKTTDEQRSKVIANSFMLLLLSSAVGAVIILIFSGNLSHILFSRGDFGSYIILSFVSAVIYTLTTPQFLCLQFKRKSREFAILSLFVTIFTFGFSTIGLLYIVKGIKGYLLGQIAGYISGFIMSIYISKLTLKLQDASFGTIKELTKVGVPLIPSFIFIFIMLNISRYFLQALWGLDSVGIYTVGYTIGMTFNLIVSSFSAAWLSFFMSYLGKDNEAEILFGRIFSLYYHLCGILLVAFFLYSHEIVYIAAGKGYRNSAQIIGIIAAANFFIGIHNLFLPPIYFNRDVKIVSFLQGIAALIAIFINWLIVKGFGIFGAGLSVMVNFLILAILTYLWDIIKLKDGYIRISYEWGQIAILSLIILVFIPFEYVLWGLSYNFTFDLLLSTFLFTLFITVTFLILPNNEKSFVIRHIKEQLRGLKCVV